MCRLMAYIGPPRLIADVVLWPDRSIIKQSYDARERLQDPSLPNHLGFGNLNGDGFGIGWYTSDELREEDPTPCMYKSITPAWNNENLARLSSKIISPLVFAHVRAAYPGMPVSEQNCHPFHWGRYIWMHNGVVGGFSKIKRKLLEQLSDAAYNSVQSYHSDSAVSFAVFLNQLPDVVHQQPPDVLVTAMQATISAICAVQDQLGVQDVSLLNFVVSDGSTLIATRFVRPESEGAATLYYAEGGSYDRQEQQNTQHHGQGGAIGTAVATAGADDAGTNQQPHGQTAPSGAGEDGSLCGSNNLAGSSVLREASYNIGYRERGARVAFVASEPITGSTTDWVSVQKNTVVVVTREKGGFLSMLQSSLSPGKAPSPRLQEVSTCLASIAQGVNTQSRAWIARRTSQQQQDGFSRTGNFSQNSLLGMLNAGDGADADGATSLMDGLLRSIGSGEPETISMEEEHMLTGHTRSVLALVLDEQRGRLYSSSIDATVRAWDVADMNCLAVIRGHSKPVTHLQLLGGRLLFTAAGGGIRVWCTKTFLCLEKIKTSFYSGAIRSMLVADNGTIYVGHQDTTVKKYLPINPAAAAEASASGGVPFSPRTTNPGGLSTVSGPVRQPDAQTNLALGHVGQVNALVACGPYICSAGGDTTVRVWHASDLSFVRVLRGHRGSILCLLAVNNMLLSGSRDNTIRVWDLDLDFMCRRTLIGHKDDVVHLDALGLNRGSSISSSSSAASAPSPAARAASPAPFANPVLVASASADGTVRIWSSSWTCLRILTICAPCAAWKSADLHQQQQDWQEGAHPLETVHEEPRHGIEHSNSMPSATGSHSTAAAAAALLQSAATAAGHGAGGHAAGLNASNGTTSNGQLAVVGFASRNSEDGETTEQHPRPGDPEYSLRNSTADSNPASPVGKGRHAIDFQHRLTCHTSFNGWSSQPQQTQQPLQHLQQQKEQPHQQQSPPQQPSRQGSQKQQHGYQRHRQRRRTQQQQQLTPATAALVVAMSTHHVVGGYSDASIRLWHMDDVYLADLTEQLVSGQLQDSDLELWQEQLRPISAATSFNPFLMLSAAGSINLGANSMVAAGTSLSPRSPAGELFGATPPLSPTGLAGQLASRLMTGQLTAGATGQLLSEGSGITLGVEVLAAERQRQRGAWCARLRDAGCCSGGGSGNAAKGSSPAGLSGVLQSSGLSSRVLCLACGSQDQQLIRALKEFVAIRSVSAHKVYRDECLRGAKYLSRLLEALGAEVKMAQPYEGKNPVVMGRLGHNPAVPTVAFYGHYDVQPAEEPDWQTNPFEMCAVDGYLCGRGTSDNKGPILAFIYAVKEMLDCWRIAGAAAPINVAFMFEGEEENGSQGFQQSIAANLDWFSDAVLVVISNTVWVGENKPCLTYGMRGMVTASLVVSGPERDLHSGNDGGVFSEPMVDLVQLLGSLHEQSGKINVPGFYNNVRPQLMDLAWQGLQHSEEFNIEGYREAIGVPGLTAPPNTHDLLHKRWCLPSLSIVDVRTATATMGSISSSSRPAVPSPGGAGSAGNSKASPSLKTYAQNASPASNISSYRHTGCPHMHGNNSSSWPSVVHISHTEKHASAAGTDERSCYRFGPTRFSVIPKVAVGKISLRFVPEQDHQTLIECLQQHIQLKFKQLWSANKVELQVHSVGDWWEADPQSQLFQMAERAVRREWGEQPLYVREGGTMPVACLIEKMLGAPALMIPMGQSSDNCHLANERLRRVNLIKGKNVVRHLLEEVAAAAVPVAGLVPQSPAAGMQQPAAAGITTGRASDERQKQLKSMPGGDAVVTLADPHLGSFCMRQRV